MSGLHDPSPSRPGRSCIGWLRSPHVVAELTDTDDGLTLCAPCRLRMMRTEVRP